MTTMFEFGHTLIKDNRLIGPTLIFKLLAKRNFICGVDQ